MTTARVPRCVACGAAVKDAAQYQAARCPKAKVPDLDPRHTLTLGAKDALGVRVPPDAGAQ